MPRLSGKPETNMPRLSFILPTRNRPEDVRVLLGNLAEQSVRPDQIIIVDSSDKPQQELTTEFPHLKVSYHRFEGEPSAATQRNAGLEYVASDVDLIGFVDDDIVFEKDALEKMLLFWKQAADEVCGAAFNLDEKEKATGNRLKHSGFVHWLGLYHPDAGEVAPSGWHTRLGQARENTNVAWLISGAVLWRKDVLLTHRFDPFFQGYSYLEDLDFSYSLSRKCRLVVVADAVFHHHHHHQDLSSDWYFRFGRMEVRNRLYFVRKHGLSVWRCYLGLCVRLGKTLLEVIVTPKTVLLARARGNAVGLWDSFKGKKTGA